MAYLFDTFTNFLSGLGVPGRDKMTGHRYVRQLWTRDQLEAAYQTDWIARKAIQIPAQDATRAWRAWQAEQDQIEEIEATEDRLHVQLKLQEALVKSRLYGGCCILIGVDGDMKQELDPESIKKDGLKFLHVLAPHQLVVQDLERDITSEYYGQPKYYTLFDESGKIGSVDVHPSRMVRLIGLDPPDPMLNYGWGDPLMQTISDAVSAAGTVTQSIAAMIAEAKFDVVKIPGLTEIFATDDGTARLIKRFTEANVAKSVINAIVLDGEEEWQRIQVQFRGMPEIMQMYMQIAAGAADIPVTRFLGMSPAGLNSTGESDLTNYYDRISSDQKLRLMPALEKLDKAIQMSALGSYDDNIFYEWNPLWQMSDTEKAAIALSKSQATTQDVNSGLVPFEALVKGRCNQLIEDGTYPGLESAIEEAIANAELMQEEQMQLQQAQQFPGDDPNNPDGGGNAPPNGKGGPPPMKALPPPKPAPEMLLKRSADSITIKGVKITRAEWRKMFGDEAPWNEEAHSRGQPKNAGQFGPGGGGHKSDEPKAGRPTPEAVLSKKKSESTLSVEAQKADLPSSYTFVSPSVKTGMDIKGANVELASRQQAMLRQASDDIDNRLGITDSKDTDVIGVWVDPSEGTGAENSMMTSSNTDWDHAVLAGVMKAHLQDQKAVLVFQQQAEGKQTLVQFEATGKLESISKKLAKAGLSNHTLVPTSTGARVYVMDMDGSLAKAIEKGATAFGKDNPIHFQHGRGEFIPAWGEVPDTGTDREQRDGARRVYEARINQSPVAGASAIWKDVHDTWSPPSDVPGYRLTSNAILAEQSKAVKGRSVLVTDAAKQLQARSEKILKEDLGVDHVDYENHTPEMDNYVSGVIATDLKQEIKSGQSGADWYDQTMKDAIHVADQIYPGIAADPNKKFAYTASLAITSQGEEVPSNVRLADQAYSYYAENGKFPEDISAADPNIAGNFAKMNSLIKTFGLDGTRKLFTTQMTKAELTKKTGYEVGGFGVDDTVWGSAVLGQKIGQGFYQNLNGNFDPVTIDMWFMRAWGRTTGTGVQKTDMVEQLDRVNKALVAAGLPEPKSKKETIDIAEGIYDKHEKDFAAHQKAQKEKEAGTKEKYKKTELVLASERLMLYYHGMMVEQPMNQEHRKHMETVFKMATDKLAKEDDIHLSQASAQAIWWWPEKLLWERMGVAPKKQDTDYLKSLKELAAKKGVKLEDAVMDAMDDEDDDEERWYNPWIEDPDPPDYMTQDEMRKAEDTQWKYRHEFGEDSE